MTTYRLWVSHESMPKVGDYVRCECCAHAVMQIDEIAEDAGYYVFVGTFLSVPWYMADEPDTWEKVNFGECLRDVEPLDLENPEHASRIERFKANVVKAKLNRSIGERS